MIRLGALFAGVGGLELGLENAFKIAGIRAETVYQVELDDAARKVLKTHWPHARRYADVTAIDPHSLPDVDLIAGGFPCQDLSVAGRGAGIEHGKRSSLWRVFKEIVHVKQPALVVVGERQPGARALAPDRHFRPRLARLPMCGVSRGCRRAWSAPRTCSRLRPCLLLRRVATAPRRTDVRATGGNATRAVESSVSTRWPSVARSHFTKLVHSTRSTPNG